MTPSQPPATAITSAKPMQQWLTWLVLMGILLLAINMRAPIIGFGAVAKLIEQDLHLSTKTIGMVGTIPVAAFALSSFIAPKISHWLGLERTMLLASLGLMAGIFLRVWQPQLGFLLVGTVVLSLAISLANVLVPAVIKKFLPHHISRVMSVYSLTMTMTAGLSAGIAMWLVGLKNWQFALGVWGWISLLAMIIWLIVLSVLAKHSAAQSLVKSSTSVPSDLSKSRTSELANQPAMHYPSVWKMPMAWYISIFMGIQSLLYYTMASFLPSLLMDKGLSTAQVGTLGMIFQMMGFPAIMLLSYWVGRGGNLRVIAMLGAVGNLIGVLGFGFLSAKLAWLWALFTGFGCGVIFTLCLMIFTIKARDDKQTAQLSGMSQSVGYSIAIFGPLVVGWLKDVSHGWTLPMLFLAVLMAIKCVVAWLATQDRGFE